LVERLQWRPSAGHRQWARAAGTRWRHGAQRADQRPVPGYVAQKGDGALNHFFGSIFTGTPTDKAIFDRIDFGRKRDLLCGKDKGGEHPADK
jgi:hypothetical protein